MSRKALPITAIEETRKSNGLRKRESGPMSPKAVRQYEERYRIMCMRRDGHSIEEIADALNHGKDYIKRIIDETLDDTMDMLKIDTEHERKLQIMRLDNLLKTYTAMATEGYNELVVDPRTNQQIIVQRPPNPAYAQLILQIEQRRAKLIALDMPETKHVSITAIRQYVSVDLDKV